MELHLSITSPLRIPHHSHLSSELFFRINMEPTRILTSEFGSAILFWICAISSLLVCQAAIAVRRFHKVYRTSELFCVVTVYFFLYHYISLWAFQIDCDPNGSGFWNGAKCELRPFDHHIIGELIPALVAAFVFVLAVLRGDDEPKDSALVNAIEKKIAILEEKLDKALTAQRNNASRK
ncbi:hypothetical protein SCHPADRAFT_947345 [Schizopora paradoxa]|uniref:Uncharacterized protein n=1 Tax=Schizopora paradoxa TaxID=27342 RepID=A0A0H2QZU2_9AGAM|nr:hypothetical protein SCHPADRAFT_947345 [Schizopora paradoxa]